MSTALDIELIPEVKALIDEFGKTVTITDERLWFDELGNAFSNGAVSQTVKITPPDPDTLKYISDDTVRQSELGAFVAAQGLTITLKPGIKLTMDGVIWTVKEVSTIRTGDDIALHGLGLSK